VATLTETIPASVRPADPRNPKNDPLVGWDAVTHQLGVVAPLKALKIRGIRATMLASLKV
jgi:hypothetical protein